MGEIMNSPKGVKAGVPEIVSISCPTAAAPLLNKGSILSKICRSHKIFLTTFISIHWTETLKVINDIIDLLMIVSKSMSSWPYSKSLRPPE